MTNDEKKELIQKIETENAQTKVFRELVGEEFVDHILKARAEALNLAESLSESLYYGGQLYVNMGDFADMVEHLVALEKRVKLRDVPTHLLEED